MLFEVALSIDHVSDFNNHIYCKSDKHEEILDYPRILRLQSTLQSSVIKENHDDHVQRVKM